MRISIAAGVGLAALLCAMPAQALPRGSAASAGSDWTRFGYDAARHDAGPANTGIRAANVARLRPQRVAIGGTADSSPIYLHAVTVKGSRHDVFVVTTSYGRTVAVDAASGRVLWRFTPRGYAGWAGTYRITNASPVASVDRRFVYAASPGGHIHKLVLATGVEVRSGSWPAAITRNPGREKLGTALNLSRGLVLATTGGYIGDQPPYQGHVAAVDAASGRLVHVWNALCSDRHALISPSSCADSGSAIWGRSGAAVVPGTGRILVATGNGKWNGRTAWGDSALMLSPDAAHLLQNWTPTDQAQLDQGDVDLGSTSPGILNSRYAVQGGKDGKLRLLDLGRMNGHGGAGAFTGGELQTLSTPGGLFTAPAVWTSGGRTWVFLATGSGTEALTLDGGRLHLRWRNGTGGTSPVVAGGLLYVYDPDGGRLNVYVPGTGNRVASLVAARGHWNSPVVADGRVALPVGDANDHNTSGSLYIYRLSGAGRRPAAGYHWRIVNASLYLPTQITAPRSQPNRLYGVLQSGIVIVMQNDVWQTASPFLDIQSLVKSGGEQGLLSLAFHPNYAKNRKLYVDYTDLDGNTRVVEYRANRAGTKVLASTARQVLFVHQPYANHNGGQLMFGPDGYLYVGMGDGGSGGDPSNNGQNLGTLLGKLIRIDVNKRGAKPQIAGYGLRNPWRFSFDRATGDLYIGDVGEARWEEIDFTPRRSPGLENYGWSVYEGNEPFKSQPLNPAGHLVAPIHVYDHSQGCAVIGGFVYRGKDVPAARGLYFFGDICSGKIWSLRVVNGKATDVRLEPEVMPWLTSFGEGARGELYACAQSGYLYQLVPGVSPRAGA